MAASSAPTRPSGTVSTILAEELPDGSVRCGVCAHRCLVRPGRSGICGVRTNEGGHLVCHAYGAAVAIGIDPIEKKPLFHVAPGTLAYSIATAGCPFHCTFCQNWEIAQGPRLGLDLPARPLPPERVVEAAIGHRAGAIAYTYVEPTVFLEYALDTGRLARDAGLLNLFITDGYATQEAVDLLAPLLHAANVDLKSFDDAFYRRLCGARLAHVLEAIVAYRRAGVWLELTTLIVPGHNDDRRRVRAADRLDRRDARQRDAVARQPVLPGLPDARHAADAARRRCAARPRSGARRASGTSTSATPPSSGSRTRTAPGAAGG